MHPRVWRDLRVTPGPAAPFRPYPTDTKKPEAQLLPGLPANERGGLEPTTYGLKVR